MTVGRGVVHLINGVFDDMHLVKAMTRSYPFGVAAVAIAQWGLDQFIGEIHTIVGHLLGQVLVVLDGMVVGAL